MRRGTGAYPADWPTFAHHLKEEAGWRCIRCQHPHDPSTGHTLTVHHATMAKDEPLSHWWAFWPLCQKCHLQVQVKVILERPWFLDFTPWSKPYLAGWFAATQLGLDLPRAAVESRQEEFLALYHAWVTGAGGAGVTTTWLPWTPADLATLRRLHAEGVPFATIAQAVGRSPSSVDTRVRMLGLPRRKEPNWTTEEEHALIDLLDRHLTYPAIAAKLGRSVAALKDRASHLKVSCRQGARTLRQTERLLGLAAKTTARWIERGWLKAHYVGDGTTVRVVDHEDLLDFLGREDYWHLWYPERIADAELRAWALDERHGLTFLTTAQVGDQLGLLHYRVNQLIRQGRIRAVRVGGGANWLVRSDWVVYPAWLPRPRGRPLTDEDRWVIRKWWGKRDAKWIARQVGCSASWLLVVATQQLGLPRLGRGYWKRAKVEKGRAA